MEYAVIVPARYGSERLPGKPVLPIAREVTGKYIIQHVYENALAARGARHVIIATDDPRILAVVQEFGGRAVMTRGDHTSGTDRIAEVAAGLDDVDVVVNVQGDEPQIRPAEIEKVARLLATHEDASMGTLATPIHDEHELRDPNAVKVVLDGKGYALYFSRATIPYLRGSTDWLHDTPVTYLKHLGIYSYRREFLLHYSALAPAPLERAERLEQLRALYNGYRIVADVTDFCPIGIDTEADLARWLDLFRESGGRKG